MFDLPLSTLRSSAPVLANPFNRGKAVPLSAEQFHYAFANTLSREESDEIYRRYHVPAASTVLFEGAFANFHRHPATEVHFARNDRAPLLFVGFGEDHVVPAKATRHNADKYAKSKATTDYREFPGRPHFPAAPGREEVTDYALSWAKETRAPRRRRVDACPRRLIGRERIGTPSWLTVVSAAVEPSC